ncbi:hypothetical protein [Caldisalinibacter kiritimatiensis]|uniref:DUF5673 domain-containing protein n=1 Tax=Caldisalinibacter kiritimatiensis TaxID=1304284 RepID=R1CV64_9FIRM|nr:hypothetical protein [Caldisalinibacter kiritimatiensis]EOD00519.1 hypothetical protein L21TH_1434 [Caldisalinibacter kiritimatiensis]
MYLLYLILTILISIITIFSVINKIKNKKEAGKVLLEIGSLKTKRVIQVLTGLYICGVVLLFFVAVKEFNLERLFQFIYWTLFLIYFVIVRDMNDKITENGILTFNKIIRWEDIWAYKIKRIYQNKQKYVIILSVKMKRKLYKNEVSQEIQLTHKVSEIQKQEIENLFNKYIIKDSL